MKLSAFSCFIPLFIARIVAGSTPTAALASSSQEGSQSMVTKLNGGALKARRQCRIGNLQPAVANEQQSHSSRTPLTQRRVSFLSREAATAPANTVPSIWGKIKGSFGSKDGLSLKEQLAKRGFAAFLTYAFLSCITGFSCHSFAWYAFSVQTGMTPLFPGQWKPFLAFLAGSVAVDASTRPFRLALSIAAAPMSDRTMSWLQRKCNGSKKLAVGIAFAAIIGSAFGVVGAGVGLASFKSGVPVFSP